MEETVRLNLEDSKIIAQIHSMADVVSLIYDNEKVLVKFRANNSASNKIKRIINEKTFTSN